MADFTAQVQDLAAHSFGTWNWQKNWKSPMLVTDAEGIYFYDANDKPYIDFSSQLVCSNLGHKNPALIEAIIKQAEKLPYAAPGFTTEAAIDAVAAFREMLPDSVAKLFFSTSGTEANDGALAITRLCKKPSYKVISRYHSFHGATPAGMAFTGDPRRIPMEQVRYTVDGVLFAPDCYCYRCPFAQTYPGVRHPVRPLSGLYDPGRGQCGRHDRGTGGGNQRPDRSAAHLFPHRAGDLRPSRRSVDCR